MARTSRLHSVPLRHQTLEATIDWSYAQLSNAEQKVLLRLSVFALGWTLEAAEAVQDRHLDYFVVIGLWRFRHEEF